MNERNNRQNYKILKNSFRNFRNLILVGITFYCNYCLVITIHLISKQPPLNIPNPRILSKTTTQNNFCIVLINIGSSNFSFAKSASIKVQKFQKWEVEKLLDEGERKVEIYWSKMRSKVQVRKCMKQTCGKIPGRSKKELSKKLKLKEISNSDSLGSF